MVVESAEVPGQAVLGFKVDDTTLQLSFISQTQQYQPGLTEEPIIRMLYTTAEAQVMSKIKWHHMIIDEGHG